MLQLKNNTAISPAITVLPNEKGIDTLYIILKASFKILPKVKLLETQIPPFQGDVYWGEPAQSSIKYASDIHLGKAATDIILIGSAQAKNRPLTSHLNVSLQVARQKLELAVFGDREWKSGNISRPAPFEQMPLVYEKAFGGAHLIQQKDKNRTTTLSEPRNPVGKGFIGKREGKEINGIQLPNLEDPRQLISTSRDQPAPACFGFISPAWQPRFQYAGTYDEAWRNNTAPYLPNDFDKRFFSMAHQALITEQYLKGNEPIQIKNASPLGELNFCVPINPFGVLVHIKDRKEKPPLFMETVLVEPNENRFSVVWRASTPCDKETLNIKQIDINYLSQKHQGVA